MRWLITLGAVSLALAACSPGPTLPPELLGARTTTLFENPSAPTDDDLALLESLVHDVANRDTTVQGLIAGPLPAGTAVRPMLWTDPELPGGTLLIGGSLELSLGGVSYSGPWPTTSCNGGKKGAEIYEAEASDLRHVFVWVDLNFERVTRVDVGPQPAPDQPGGDLPPGRLAYKGKLNDVPWYSGSCEDYQD